MEQGRAIVIIKQSAMKVLVYRAFAIPCAPRTRYHRSLHSCLEPAPFQAFSVCPLPVVPGSSLHEE